MAANAAGAAVDPMRQAYARMGFVASAVDALVVTQAIDTIDELKILDDKQAASLCQVIRRPGGTIPNPGAATRGAAATIRDPGVSISLKAETNLTLAVYYVRHGDRISRPRAAADLTLINIRAIKPLKERELAHESPDAIPTIDDRDWAKTLENVLEYMGLCLGTTGIPLAYVLRPSDKWYVKPAMDDPETNYITEEEEMIARAPHYVVPVAIPPVQTQVFKDDNKLVMKTLATIFRDHKSWPYVKEAHRKGDGRMGYYALHNHFLGINSVNTQAAQAETALREAVYYGKPRYTLETYLTVHKKQHEILTNLKKYGYSGIDEGSKVRYLHTGMQCPELQPAKMALMANPQYNNTFDTCAAYYKEVLNTNKRHKPSNISQFDRGGRGNGRGRGRYGGRGPGRSPGRGRYGRGPGRSPGRGNPGAGNSRRTYSNDTPEEAVEDRYYNNHEYGALTPGQHKQLARLRSERQSSAARTVDELETARREIAHLRSQQGGTAETEISSNRTNSNLTRQGMR